MGGFDRMMDRIDGLMEERVEYARQIKHLELKALQAQINPHFLYNSLDLINCTAISRNVPEISRMVRALGQFYRAADPDGPGFGGLFKDAVDHGVFDQRLQYDLDDLALPGAFIQLPLHPDPVVKAHVLDVHIQLNVPDLKTGGRRRDRSAYGWVRPDDGPYRRP